LGVKASATTAELAGRIAANPATIILGVDNMTTGIGIAIGRFKASKKQYSEITMTNFEQQGEAK
jgi:hydroxymethylglutaryl-CoA reductase